MRKKIILISVFLLLAISFASADSFSTPAIAPTSVQTATFDSSMCQQGTDFIVQVSPTGCTPAVVRSDLLSQQDVQVYCPLAATQLNPLINVKAITGISFPQGNYSKYVKSIGFYPAQAALSLPGQTLGNYPVLQNIGYAVINLKQLPNESMMPDSVSGNLTAKLNYNAQNIFGVGNSIFYLPQLSDSDWQKEYAGYGFWDAKGFLRATDIQGDSATIQIYDRSLNPTSTVNLKIGESSNALSISGFSLCSATMKVTLNALKNADTMAKLDINGNTVNLVKNEPFLNNQCQILNMIPQGLTQDVQIRCNTDSGSKTFDLRISPKVTLKVASTGQTKDFSLGDLVYTQGDTPVYLGYIGTVHPGISNYFLGNYPLNSDQSNLVVVLIPWPKGIAHTANSLTNDELSSIASWMQSVSIDKGVGKNTILNAFANGLKLSLGGFSTALREIITGQTYIIITQGQSIFTNFQASQPVSIVGFSQGQDKILGALTLQYYQNATNDYQTVVNSYSGETYPAGNTPALDEKSEYKQMQLADSLRQRNTLATLCTDFQQRFPNAKENIGFCSDGVSLSSQSDSSNYISINGQSYLINLKSIYQPNYEDFGADILVRSPNGASQTYSLIKDTPVTINQSSNDFIQLSDLNIGGYSGNGTAKIISNTNTIPLTEGIPTSLSSNGNNYVLTLTHINLKQFAQVSLTPTVNNAGASANFSFNIGIEKRLVKLTPDQVKDELKKTNDTINTLEGISNFTGNLVQNLSQVCSATASVLVLKNFIENLGGEGIARQVVMSRAGGWYNKCSNSTFSNGKTVDQCLLDHSSEIDSDVNSWTKAINNQNTELTNLEKPYTTSSLFGGSVVNTDRFIKESSYLSQVDSVASGVSCPGVSASTATLLTPDNYKSNFFGLNDARDIELYSNILNSQTSSQTMKDIAQKGICSTLTNINNNAQNQLQVNAVAALYKTQNDNVYVGSSVKNSIPISITNLYTVASSNFASQEVASTDKNNYYFLWQDQSKSKTYLVTYSADTLVQNTYLVQTLLTSGVQTGALNVVDPKNQNPLNFAVKIYSSTSYNNPFKTEEAKKIHYFETDPFKGMPAIVPFDLQHGWYAAVEQNVATPLGTTSTTQSYTAAGQVQSFFLCNVGANGIPEFNSGGTGDDICQGINPATNQPYNQFYGLDPTTVTNLVNRAMNAIQAAARARATNPSLTAVQIENQNIPVGEPATNSPAMKCTDIMSPSDCNILFNVCDPVVCPTSRCNFGGAYPVSDVVQTGIAGSIFLCLPNSVLAGGSDIIPVCLTGIQAGLENWISVQKAYRDCLQSNLATGKMTGICDEMNSIYMCEFFWRQIQPLANIVAPAVLSSLAGQNVRGGGEYLSVQNALQTAQSSSNYITNYYAANSAKAFKLQSTQNIGSAFCQNFVSLNVPGGVDIANSLSTVDSPPQYTGTFQEIPFTTATVPPTSQYEVYYHIYAGKNSGAYYSVYLQRTGSSSFYRDTSSMRQIDSGYISVGGYQDQTKDFTATAGYNQLCINVNGQTNCDFQSVSTSFALNYLKDQYLSQEVNNTQISTEADCVSGTPNVQAFLNPNVENGASNYLNPQIYNQGITRICATNNPGVGTDPKADMQGSRWVQVGNCGNPQLKCWLDTQSVKNTITSPDINTFLSNGSTQSLVGATLQNVQSNYMTILQDSGYLTDDQYATEIDKIQSKTNANDKINAINAIIDKVFYNNQKAYLLLLRGDAYALLTNANYYTGIENPANYQQIPQGTSGTAGGTQPAASIQCPPQTNCPDGAACVNNEACISGYCNPSTSLCAELSSSSSITANSLANLMLSQSNCQCGSAAQCQSYATSIINAAKTYNEDPLLLTAIMIQESNCMQTKNGQIVQNGNSYGIMQIDSSTVSACSSIGSSSDINSNYDKNIQCGALILNQKFNDHSNGPPYGTFTCTPAQNPSLGTTYTETYVTQSDAAIRGYNGYGCNGDIYYVSHVDAIYKTLSNAIEQTPQQPSTSPSGVNPSTGTSGISSADIQQFNNFKSLFDKYSIEINTGLVKISQTDFEALLVAIANQNNWGQSTRGGSDWLMGYKSGQTSTQGAEKQIATVAGLLKISLTGAASSSSPFHSCPSGINLNADLSCTLSVLDTGYTDYNYLFGAIANNDGINYAKSVLSLWDKWKNYFSSNVVSSISTPCPSQKYPTYESCVQQNAATGMGTSSAQTLCTQVCGASVAVTK